MEAFVKLVLSQSFITKYSIVSSGVQVGYIHNLNQFALIYFKKQYSILFCQLFPSHVELKSFICIDIHVLHYYLIEGA